MSKLLHSINEDTGQRISDLEALLIVCFKLISDKLEEKPNAGVTLAKGKKNEKRVKYTEVKENLLTLVAYCGKRGMLSLGVCEICPNWSQKETASPDFGICKKTKAHCHRWDTCPDYGKRGGRAHE